MNLELDYMEKEVLIDAIEREIEANVEAFNSCAALPNQLRQAMKYRHSTLNEIKNRLTLHEQMTAENCMREWVENHPND